MIKKGPLIRGCKSISPWDNF